MYCLSGTTGPVSYGETPGETGNFTMSSARKDTLKELIARANAVPIIHIFKRYGLLFNSYNRKVTCPFKSHKGGRESSPSFWYYPETNSYCCYGCRRGSFGVDFVAEMERCSPEKAAAKILELFASEVDEDLIVEGANPSERLEIMMKFSSRVFEFRQSHSDKHAIEFIEYICWIYDRSNRLHKHDNEALSRLVEHCVEHIEIYTPQLTLTLEEGYLKPVCKP
jgi:hypothetical protein